MGFYMGWGCRYVDMCCYVSGVMAKKLTKKSKGTPLKVKRSVEWLEQDKVLRTEALGMLLRSHILKENAERICDKIDRQMAMNPDTLDWQEKEKWYAEGEQLNKDIHINDEALLKLDKVYEDLRRRTTMLYGKDVMGPGLDLPPLEDLQDGEKEDKADWWRK